MYHMEHYKLENSHLIYKDVKNVCSRVSFFFLKRNEWAELNTLHLGKCVSGGLIIPGVLTPVTLVHGYNCDTNISRKLYSSRCLLLLNVTKK